MRSLPILRGALFEVRRRRDGSGIASPSIAAACDPARRADRHFVDREKRPPANQTGDLLNSIDFRVESDDVIAFFATSDHAGYLEYGTSKMAARPNLELAIEMSDETIRSILDQVIWTALGGG